eukprot:767221-Hanusia_phi.AAC.4
MRIRRRGRIRVSPARPSDPQPHCCSNRYHLAPRPRQGSKRYLAGAPELSESTKWGCGLPGHQPDDDGDF